MDLSKFPLLRQETHKVHNTNKPHRTIRIWIDYTGAVTQGIGDNVTS